MRAWRKLQIRRQFSLILTLNPSGALNAFKNAFRNWLGVSALPWRPRRWLIYLVIFTTVLARFSRLQEVRISSSFKSSPINTTPQITGKLCAFSIFISLTQYFVGQGGGGLNILLTWTRTKSLGRYSWMYIITSKEMSVKLLESMNTELIRYFRCNWPLRMKYH